MSPITNFKLSVAVVWNLIIKTSRIYLFVGLFVSILFLLQWLFNIDQLIDIVFGDSGLSFWDRVDFMLDGFFNIFRYINDFTPVAMVLIAITQAVTLTLIISYRSLKNMQASQGATIGLSIIGVGCVACGGSILTPILGVVASNISVSLAESISDILLLLALVISYISMNKVTFLVAKQVPKK